MSKTTNYDYNDKTDEKGKQYNSLPLLEAIIQSVRFSTDPDDINIPKGKGNDMSIGSYVPNYEGFNVQNALAWAKSHVGSKSSGYCARYVRMMMEAGGMSTAGRPGSAYQYAGYLPKKGFKHIATLYGKQQQADWSKSSAQPGDIAVMAHGKHGHICMWTGVQWVSDFVQNNMWPYSGDGNVNIFRYGT